MLPARSGFELRCFLSGGVSWLIGHEEDLSDRCPEWQLQRRLRLGYTRAGRLIDMLERRGIISGYEGSKPRQVLIAEADVPRILSHLAEAEERYRTLVERLPLVTYAQEAGDPRSTFYISPQVESILGYPPDECLDIPRFFFDRIHPDDKPAADTEDTRTSTTGPKGR